MFIVLGPFCSLWVGVEVLGATERSRTADLIFTKDVLYQLSYGSKGVW